MFSFRFIKGNSHALVSNVPAGTTRIIFATAYTRKCDLPELKFEIQFNVRVLSFLDLLFLYWHQKIERLRCNMDDTPQTKIEELGHLGLLTSLNKKFRFKEKIDMLLPKTSNNQKLSHGEAVLGMIYQSLGFGDGRLYFAKDFFANKPLDLLFGKNLDPAMFNDDVLGAALDAISDYGATNFFSNLAFRTLIENNLVSKFVHLDTTTHSLHGRKYEDGRIKVRFGHSKGRPLLPQVLQSLVTTDSGLPFWTSVHSGNLSDKDVFTSSITAVENFVKNISADLELGFVADSALYSKKFLLNKNINSDWVSRVPESIKLAKELVARRHSEVPWTKIDQDYKYSEHRVTYGRVEQRWVVVNCRRSRHKELATFEKHLKKEEQSLAKKALSLVRKVYPKKSDIFSEIRKLKKAHPHFDVQFQILGNFRKGQGQRPKSARGHRLYISYEKNKELIEKIQNRKGKFIVATNILDTKRLKTSELVEHYLGRNSNIERCFRVLKDSALRLNQIFLKRIDRIEALLTVMTLCLFIHNLGQLELRLGLSKTSKTIPNQVGREVSNPTIKWAFQAMQNVVRVKVDLLYQTFQEFKGIGDIQRKIIGCFGGYARQIYGFP
ncbi:MAG: hypothetical protein C5B49_02610 [Bdellovibrio sp.]|nr:MAG: hypothetical protein C5B49_02610 [Bdellovibrio sp.]